MREVIITCSLLALATAPARSDAEAPPAESPVETSVILVAAPERVVATTTAPWYTDKLGDALVGAGLVAGIASALFYRSALGDRDRADTTTSYDRYDELVAQSHDKQTYAAAFAAGAAVLVTAGVISYVVREREVRTTTVSAAPTRRGGVITWLVRF